MGSQRPGKHIKPAKGYFWTDIIGIDVECSILEFGDVVCQKLVLVCERVHLLLEDGHLCFQCKGLLLQNVIGLGYVLHLPCVKSKGTMSPRAAPSCF